MQRSDQLNFLTQSFKKVDNVDAWFWLISETHLLDIFNIRKDTHALSTHQVAV